MHTEEEILFQLGRKIYRKLHRRLVNKLQPVGQTPHFVNKILLEHNILIYLDIFCGSFHNIIADLNSHNQLRLSGLQS